MKPKKGATNSPTFFIISKDTNQVKRKLSEKHPQGLGNIVASRSTSRLVTPHVTNSISNMGCQKIKVVRIS